MCMLFLLRWSVVRESFRCTESMRTRIYEKLRDISWATHRTQPSTGSMSTIRGTWKQRAPKQEWNFQELPIRKWKVVLCHFDIFGFFRQKLIFLPQLYILLNSIFILIDDYLFVFYKHIWIEAEILKLRLYYWNTVVTHCKVRWMFFLPPASEVWGKMMFLHLSVSQSFCWQGDLPPGMICIQGRGLDRRRPLPPAHPPILQDMVNERAVHILLECILVYACNWYEIKQKGKWPLSVELHFLTDFFGFCCIWMVHLPGASFFLAPKRWTCKRFL